MDLGLFAQNPAQNEARTVQRAGQTVSSLLLSAGGPAALHRALKQVHPDTPPHTHAPPPQVLICFTAYFLYFHRYIHIIMVFWSFLAGVVTFYCSLGPESLLPNIFVSIKPKTKVGLLLLDAFATATASLKTQTKNLIYFCL